MRVVAAVLRGAFVGEGFVVSDVVGAHAVDAVRHVDLDGVCPQVANDGSHRDVHNVVAEPASIGPASRDQSAIGERILHLALEHIAAEDAQAREARVIRIRRVPGAAAGETHARCREIHFDQIGDINAGDVRSSGFDGGTVALEHNSINQPREFRVLCILAKEFAIRRGAGGPTRTIRTKSSHKVSEL
jgi:hypothetical protein